MDTSIKALLFSLLALVLVSHVVSMSVQKEAEGDDMSAQSDDVEHSLSKRSLYSLRELMDTWESNAANQNQEGAESAPLQVQKRHFCRRYFVYNPVNGRCVPTLLALRKGRAYRGGYGG